MRGYIQLINPILCMSHQILLRSVAEGVARDAPDEVKRLIDKLAEYEKDVAWPLKMRGWVGKFYR